MIDLDEATRALREQSDGASVGAPQTRARIMRSLHERGHRRRLRWGFGIPLAVVFAGSTAFAGARGDLGDTVQRAMANVRSFFGGTSSEPAETPAPTRGLESEGHGSESHRSEPPPVRDATVTPEEKPEAVNPAPAPNPAPPSPTAAKLEAAPQPSNIEPTVEDPATAAALRLYRSAHEAQFVKADCAAAVAGYDAYLQAAPGDRLVPEARYNRALCLVHLGRTSEAKSALLPFADGRYGAFRKREAGELLDALGH